MSKTREEGTGKTSSVSTTSKADGQTESTPPEGESARGLVNWFRRIPVQAKITLIGLMLSVPVAIMGIVLNVWKDEVREFLDLRNKPSTEEVRPTPSPVADRKVRFKVQMRPSLGGDYYYVADIFVNQELKANITNRRDSQLKHSEMIDSLRSPEGKYQCKLSLSYYVDVSASRRLVWASQVEREMRLNDDDVLEVMHASLKDQHVPIPILLNVTAGESIDHVLAELKNKYNF